MNHNRLITNTAVGMLVLPLVGAGVIAGMAKISQVHAQEVSRYSPANHLVAMQQVMSDPAAGQSMIKMMQTHHGDNWQDNCDQMMSS